MTQPTSHLSTLSNCYIQLDSFHILRKLLLFDCFSLLSFSYAAKPHHRLSFINFQFYRMNACSIFYSIKWRKVDSRKVQYHKISIDIKHNTFLFLVIATIIRKVSYLDSPIEFSHNSKDVWNLHIGIANNETLNKLTTEIFKRCPALELK